MTIERFHNLIGLSGIDPSETDKARLVGRIFEIPAIFIALWIIVAWYWSSTGKISEDHTRLLDYSIWLFYVLETSIICYFARKKTSYLLSNWLNLIIIIAGIPILWDTLPYTTSLRALRLMIFLSLIAQLSRSVRMILARNHLGTTLFISFLVIIVAGYIIAGIDPNIHSPMDGIWWAWVTVSTVGYGDVVPVSAEGRMFASLLIVLGIGLFSMITASFSVFFISQSQEEELEHSKKLEELNAKLNRIEKTLEDIKNNCDKK